MTGDSPPILDTTSGRCGVLYEESLAALVDVLEAADEPEWRLLIFADLQLFRSAGGNQQNRQAYAGMGTLGDLVLNSQSADAPWMNAAVRQLTHLAAMTATRADLDRDDYVQVNATAHLQLSWYRCRQCEQTYVGERDLVKTAAEGWASWVIPRLMTDNRGADIAKYACGRGSSDERGTYLRHAHERAAELGLILSEVADQRGLPCPACGAHDWWAASGSVF